MPLLLVVEQRTVEACTIIKELAEDVAGKGQMLPDIPQFMAWFRGEYCH